MPVYHLVFHALGSWLPDHAEGYNDRKSKGRKPQNEKLGEIYRDQLTKESIEFNFEQRDLLLKECHAIVLRYNWRLHASAVATNHIHILLSWKEKITVNVVQGRLKQYMTHALSRHAGTKSGRWFARGAGIIRVRDLKHMGEIMTYYIPGHGECVWVDDRIRLDD